MYEIQLNIQLQELLNIFVISDILSEEDLIFEIKSLDIEKDFCNALEYSIKGNYQLLNKYLFDLPVNHKKIVGWIAPVLINRKKRYAWMIGAISSEISEIRKKFDKASSSVRNDPILMCNHEPKPLLFVEPFAVSSLNDKTTSKQSKKADDFAIFQVGYRGNNKNIDDFDQRLILNNISLEKNLKSAILKAQNFIVDLQKIDVYQLNKQAKIFAMLHAEAHNRGHFAGSWPFNKSKNIMLHEAVEEFRACLNAIRWIQHLKLTTQQKQLFALSVFIIRFFHYGYKAYIDPMKTNQSVREISVGLMFFEVINKANVFRIDYEKKVFIQFRLDRLIFALDTATIKLNQQELEARAKGINELRQVSRFWYKVAYPNASLSPEAKFIYDYMQENCIA